MPTVDPAAAPVDEDDAPIQISAARGALQVRAFRTVWLGAFASGIGSWMQQVTLGAFAYELTGSASFVSLTFFAQMGPVLVLSLFGGALADMFDRRRLIIGSQLVQAASSAALAIVVMNDEPSRISLLIPVFAHGVANAVNAPAWNSLLPTLVPREHLAGAVSLQSTQLNSSRVVGPAIAGALYPSMGAAGVFAINAASFVFSIGSLFMIETPRQERTQGGPTVFGRIAEGLRVARHDPVVRGVLFTIMAFSLVCLPFIGQMPTHAAESFGIRPKSFEYGVLYATFGLGAVIGAVSIGTFFSGADLHRVVRRALLGFAASLAVFALLESVVPAYVVAVILGFSYFASVTSLSTILQSHVPDQLRGRVMSIWQMAFAGVVPLGLAIAGPIADATSIRVVLLYGAVCAVGLAVYARVSALKE